MKKADQNCTACNGSGIRDIWVVDGWSATDCLCEDGWTFDETTGTWKEPAEASQDKPEKAKGK